MALEDEEEEQQQQPKMEDPQLVPTLLPEIIVEILSRLPVESLLRCRSVCKLWYSIISDSHFVKSHLSLSASNNLYAHHRLIFNTEPRLLLKSCPLYDVLYDESVNFSNPDYPSKHPPRSVFISGSCNGLFLIVIKEDILFIWNPSTRKSNMLPYCGFEMRPGVHAFYGFGYDESTDDYKVVGISLIFKYRDKYVKRVKMYSLKIGNWKEMGVFPHDTLMDDSGKLSNGALHWVSKDFGWTIVSVDLAKETYGEILQAVYDEGDYDLTLGALGEWLCVMCNYHRDHADVWVMKVYGVKDSWTKLVSIPYLSLTDPDWDKFSVPIWISKDGKVLLQFGENLVVYDSKNRSFSQIRNFDECLEAYVFVESLVSPDNNQGGNQGAL